MWLAIFVFIISLIILILEYSPIEGKYKKLKIIIPISLVILLFLNMINSISEEKEQDKLKYYGVLIPQETTKFIKGEGQLSIWEFGFGLTHPGAFIEVTEGKPISAIFTNKRFKALDESLPSIEKVNGKIMVSATVRDVNGQIVAKLSKNEWFINHPEKAMDRNYTENMLEVIDHTGSVVFQVRLFKNRMQVNGIFYASDGTGVAVFPSEDNKWAVFHLIDKNNPPNKDTVELFFKYPSHLHLGELAGQ